MTESFLQKVNQALILDYKIYASLLVVLSLALFCDFEANGTSGISLESSAISVTGFNVPGFDYLSIRLKNKSVSLHYDEAVILDCKSS